MYYEAIDRWNNGSPYLEHAKHKYIKKIQIGPYTRYFYTLDAVKAYYDSLNKNTNKQSRKYLDKTNDKLWENLDLANGTKLRDKFNRGFIQGMQPREVYKLEDETMKAFDKHSKYSDTYKKENKVNALKKTGKFALDNFFGNSSKREAKDYYKARLNFDTKAQNKKNRAKYGTKKTSFAEKVADTVFGAKATDHTKGYSIYNTKSKKRKRKTLLSMPGLKVTTS